MVIPQTEILASKEGVEIARFVVQPGEYVIGREGAGDLRIEDNVISHQHARLTISNTEVLIEDLGSANGTYIGGRQVNECTRVWPNQKVFLGSVLLLIRRLKAPDDSTESLAPQTKTIRRLLPPEFLREKKYEIGGVVAQGAMGAVLDAWEVTTHRTVAMKVMLAGLSESDLLRFIEEAQITSQLEHPNIVPLHELGVDENDQVFYTMKLVKGITLRKILDLLAKGVPETIAKYPLRRLMAILLRICDAIAFAHSRSVLHRDLKPENVMVGDFGEVLLMDWGLAKIMIPGEQPGAGELAKSVALSFHKSSEERSATLAGAVIGTPQYMSPEQANGNIATLDQRTDVYALGAILYHMLALRPPIAGRNVTEMLERTRDGKITPLKNPGSSARNLERAQKRFRHCPGGRIPDSLAAVAMRALSLRPEDRYESAAAFRNEIDAYLGGFATAAEQASLLKQLSLLIARNRTAASILGAGLILFLISAPLVLIRVNNERMAAEKARSIAEIERSKADAERERAQSALEELRKAAPAYFSEAQTLADEQKYSEALTQDGLALSLVPNNPEYTLFRAHTLEAMQRLPEAIESYQQVLAVRPRDASAKANLALCKTLLRQNAGRLPLPVALLSELLDAVIAEKRSADSVYLARAIGRESEVVGALFQTQLKSILSQAGWKESRLQRLPDHTFSLDLSDLSVPDVSGLKGLPISILNLARSHAADLSPLAGLPLRDLDVSETGCRSLNPISAMQLHRLCIGHTNISDLAPIRKMPLEQLDISYTPVTDISPITKLPLTSLDIEGTNIASYLPLRGRFPATLNVRNTSFNDCSLLAGMPLKTLYLGNTQIHDITALAGMPLVSLELSGCAELADISPLASCVGLQNLLIPSQIVDVAFLRRLPALARLSNAGFDAFDLQWTNVPLATEFFAQQGAHLARLADLKSRLTFVRAALLGLGLTEDGLARRIHVDEYNLTVDLDLSQLPVREIEFLRGLPLRQLKIPDSQITDLSPLRGSPIVELIASNMAATDLSPLAACPNLHTLIISHTNIDDLRLLAAMKLQKLDLAFTAVADLTMLGGMSTLQDLRISGTKISDLGPLIGIPLRQLKLDESQVTDISPLRGMPLESLDLSGLRVTSLTVLRSMPDLRTLSLQDCKSIADYSPVSECRNLTAINLGGSNITDLNCLAGLKLKKLYLMDAPVKDISVAAGMPIEEIYLNGTSISDLSPLLECPIEEIIFPKGAKNIDAFRKLPTIKRISQGRGEMANGEITPGQTADQFWQSRDQGNR